ncbi:MAG: urea ABC transporter ATP-binding protein UrtD [Gammaproteobacteria bacterium]|nr:urea ABC transporter ATP-binding protein UrtD [Gammaproteobacteria bacterium]
MHKHIDQPSLLYVDGVTVTFDGFRALNSLSLILQPGEMRAIIGPNGAGKTTMMDVITGKTRPDKGTVLFRNEIDLTRHDEADIASLGIGRKFQKPSVIESLSVFENLELAIKGQRGVFQSLFFALSRAQAQRIDEILELVRLAERRKDLAGSLSHGQKQWLEIGMLLIQGPDLLLIDEPAAGMTDAETERTADLFRELAKSHSLVVVEHDMHFIRALDCKVTVLHEGSVLAEGTLDQVQQNQKVVEVYLGR